MPLTGAGVDAGDVREIRTADAWAPDSSGVFVAGDDGIEFRAVDGRVAVIAGLGGLRSVAVHPSD